MATVTPRTLSGFMELLPAPQQQMERMMEILRTTYSRYGFTPLDTPAIEASEVLLAKGGGETEKQIYRFQKGDADLSLRFDLTVPLAKYVALHYNDLAFPFRRYQIGKVYRGERAQRGRFREFYQADIDIIGDGKLDITNEAEIPSIIYQTFTSLGLTRFQIRVNNRKILNGFYAMLGLTEQSGDIMRTVDKLDKIGAGPDLPDGGRGTDGGAGRRDHAVHLHHRQQPAGAGRSGRVSGAAQAVRPGAGGAEHRHPLSLRLRRSGGEFRRGSDHRPGPGLLHRHGV